MMKMAMRPQKTQVQPTQFKWTAGEGGFFDKRPYLQVGFRNFDVMLVGAAGGRSGRAGNSSRGFAYPAGGGGGGSKRVQGLLTDLPTSCAIEVGLKGVNGGNSTVSSVVVGRDSPIVVKAWAGDGDTGGSTIFGPYSAPGGQGGKGGEVAGSDEGVDRITASTGGKGGNNPDLAAGAWDDVTKIGQGGNGGKGKVTGGADAGNGTAGAQGFGYNAPTEGAQGNTGGTGGGANIAPITGGAAEYYGTGSATTADGVVYLKIS